MNGTVGRRYARALFALAKAEGRSEEIGEALGQIARSVAQSLGDREPAFLTRRARERLGEALAEQVGPDSLLGRFLRVVCSRGRLGQLPAIHRFYQALADADRGVVRAHIRSATALDEPMQQAVSERFAKLTGKRVLAQVETDPSLIGGLIVEIQGKVFDGSLRTALANLSRRMAGGRQ